MYLVILQHLLWEAFLDIFYFPIWWYTGGAKQAALKCLSLLKMGNERLAPGIWLTNIFVPMFGQYDWQGRIISFFIRLFEIIVRVFGLMVWLIFCLILFLLWLVLPVVIVMGLVNSFR